MIPELGHLALILALVLALVQAIVPLVGVHTGRVAMMAVARPVACGQFFFMLLSFAALLWAFTVNDFSVVYVYLHSNTNTPLMYRLTAVWGSHEGSLLLWALSLSAWTAAVTVFSRRLPLEFVARVLAVLGWISIGFILFMLLTSNPFLRLLPGAPEGRDLNPLLQDPGMIIHPPLLYMGYVGFSVAFAFAIAALITGRLDAAWARWSRPWTTTAWVFLTLGIAVGAGWAYYELGWGGWWFWDPVENASFMPWLLGTALIHSLAVTEKRGAFRSWTVLLSIGAFSLSLLGTFLVRSGILTSVHAFATDPQRGLFILGFLVLVIGTSLLLFAWRAPRLSGGGSFALVSREAALLGNNVMLSVVSFSVLLGTMYPLITDALRNEKLSVGPPYFEAVFVPLMAPVVLLMMFGPFLRWKEDGPAALLRRLAPALLASAALGVGGAWLLGNFTWRTMLGLFLAAWVLLASVQLLAQQLRPKNRAAPLWRRVRAQPASWWGMWLAHAGVGIFIVGVTMVGSIQQSLDMTMKDGQHAEFAGYTFHFNDVREVEGPNYTAWRASMDLRRGDRTLKHMEPEKRIYHAHQMPMSEVALDITPLRDIYVALGDPLPDGGWVVHLHFKPFISWIWAGCILMALGGILATLDRRYRPRRKSGNGGQAAVAA